MFYLENLINKEFCVLSHSTKRHPNKNLRNTDRNNFTLLRGGHKSFSFARQVLLSARSILAHLYKIITLVRTLSHLLSEFGEL